MAGQRLPWFRMYHAIIDDGKLGPLTLQDLGAWLKLMCIAARYGGVLPPISKVAFHMRLSEAEAQAWVDTFTGPHMGLFEATDEGISPHDWAEWQYTSDGAAERMRAYRERKRSSPVTQQSRNCADNSVTKCSSLEQIQNRTEQNRERAEQTGARTHEAPLMDELWPKFKQVATDYGMACSEPEWEQARQWAWVKLDYFQQAAAIKGITDRQMAGDYTLVNALPKNYLQQQMWKRNIKQPQQQADKPLTLVERWARGEQV